MKRLIFTLVGIICTLQLSAQQFAFSTAEKLKETVNTEAEEINPRPSEDGSTLYFTRVFSKKNVGGQYAGQDIWYSPKAGNDWETAKNLKVLNNGDNNAVVGINHSGDKLYLINNYTAHSEREKGLVSTNKTDSRKGWSKFEQLPVLVQVPNDHYGFYLTPEEDVLIISMMGEESKGEEDLYVSLNKNGEWEQPRHLGSIVNSSGFEISPFLLDDKKTLFFSSNGMGGKGDADIFYTTRLDDTWTNWSTPQNAGGEINSSAFDAYLAVSSEGQAYFSSNRGLGLSNIYKTKMSIKQEDASPKEEEIVVEEPIEKKEEPIEVEEIKEETPVPLPTDLIVYFDFESDVLTSEAKRKLDGLIQSSANRNDFLLELEGHTDERGTQEYNMDLSRRRVQKVRDYLVNKNLKNSTISVSHRGENELVRTGKNSDDHKLNRRVELVFKRSN